MRYSSSSKLSREGRSDEGAEGRPSHFSRRGLRGTSQENALHFWGTNSPKKACLENACLFWLVMLYYKHRRLNGLGSPFGIETPLKALPQALMIAAKWPGKPVRD